ncbi:uncharacterized protein ACWYII_031249 isoform 10-T12 [Salvelinus alpinus]
MACTRQSALEYIQNGRRLLVERLQNLSLVVENLFQRKVLQEEEVSKIQAEVDRFDQTRKILDWVTAKGEAACYELLMILDITRKRTLDNADLQQWISCFPFKEDPEMTDYLVGSKPCHRYQSQLKCKARKITEGAWKQSSRLLPERNRNEVTFSYTPLVLDTDVPSSLSKIETKSKRCKKARPKKLKSFIPMAKQETSPADLLKTPMRRILLFGKPGIGKTAVAHQMLNLWAQKDHRELDYMFYFDVRDISPSTNPMRLEDLLFNMYSEPEESREEVLQDIKKNSENVVIIFDGITYLSSHSVIKKLVDKDLLPDAKIVITCRPEVPSRDFLTDWPSFRVEVKGFSNESIRAYLIKMLSAEPNPTPNHDSLSSVLNNLELFSLCHVPMYALMVVACIYYSTPEASKQPWPTTKMYINILRYCILKHSGKQTNDLNKCLVENREKILSLAKIAFDATQQKTMNLTELSCELSSVQFSFLGALMIMVEPTVSDTYSAFLHYTMQEFFGALWLLQNPDKIREVLQKCQTEEWKHTKHMVPFMCGLLNERNIQLVNGLVPAQQTKKTSDWFLKEVVNTFLPLQTNQDHAEGDAPEFEIDLLFLCQCLYESQSTEACLLLLDKLDYNLDLDEEHLDPHQCCAVSYMISQSAERKVGLDLNSCTVSDQGLRLILASLKNVRYLGSDPSMLCQLWTTLLSGEADIDFTSLLGLCGNELRLPFLGERRVFERAEEVMKQSLERVNLLLHWDRTTLLSEALSKTILKCLTHINKLSFTPLQHQRGSPEKLEKEEKAVLLDLCLQAGLYHRETFQGAVNTLLSLFSVYQTERYDILLDLYSHVKYNRKQAGRSILPSLRPLYQPAPAVWSIDLSERKASLLLEVLKLQPEKKSVELKYWSDEESEVRSFLQCLPYISQLRIAPPQDQRRSPEDLRKREKTFLLNLCLQAALHERENIQTTVEKVSLSEVYHDLKWDLLLDLYSHVKNYETQTGRSVLPALQTVYQSAPAVWSIDLSERKVSLLLEVLKLQPEKKPVELWGWSDEESEVRSFLQCLPYISELGFTPPQYQRRSPEDWRKREKTFLLNMCLQAALHERETIQTTVEKVLSLSEVYHDRKWDLLLDLYSHVKDYETQTGRSVLPALQPVYQSAPAVWSIDLSERKASLLLEVLKLQPGKKPVELKYWSDEESEVRSFLQCLPYISQLSFPPPQDQRRSPEEWRKREKTFLLNLCLQAALHERETIQTTVEKVLSLSEVYHDRKWSLLLDLYSHVKDYETQTGRSVLPALQPVYQSAPAVWSIDLSERKASLLLEVLKLQPEKKPVQLEGWSDEESEVRSFLQCLPYISQLSFPPPQDQRRSPEEWRKREKTFLLNLCLQAALHERETIQTTVEKVLSLSEVYHDRKWSLLLDLYSHVKDYETQTGRSVLPALQPVYQSAPAVWSIDLSERKASLLLEVLKLQPEKKPVQLEGWSDEESEVRSFLQCLPYISQLSFPPPQDQRRSPEDWRKREKTFLLNMCLQAALHERENIQTTVEKVSLSEVYHDLKWDLLLDLYSHVKNYETQTGRSVLPALQTVYQSAPAVWSIDLSERKVSLLLEVLKLQPEKKPVELWGWSDEESEVRSFLQCLPYISELGFIFEEYEPSELIKFLVGLLSQAAEWEEQSGEKTLKLLSSVCTYSTFPLCDWDDDKKWFQCDFLLDLYSHVKDYETQTGRSVLPALQTVYQSAPAVWYIDLSERKASLLLEVLKLQSEKKPVQLEGWSDEDSEVRSFLQCLPYISQLRFLRWSSDNSELIKFLVGLLSQAAEWEEQSGEKTLKLVSSVCTYSTFPLCDGDDYDTSFQCDFLLDLYSHVKDYETQTGRSVLPALQPVYQSAPAVWSIDLSERKVSLLLDVLKLQPVKKPVELKGWSDEESEVRSFLQCLPYISQLRRRGGKQPLQLLNCSCSFTPPQYQRRSPEDWRKREKTFLLNMCLQAALHERETIQTTVEKVLSLSEVYHDRKWDLLLDLYSHVKDYETQTGRSVLPALQPVYQSAPAVWSIDLSERKASLLLEVLKLQPGKKPVELKYWSDEESEVRSFLQCLPYISQLSFHLWRYEPSELIKFLVGLLSQAAEWEEQSGEKTLKLLSSVCTYSTFPLCDWDDDKKWFQCDFLLDLYSHVKDYETQTGRSVLPALQPVYQSAPAVWSIDLSERKASLLLEVLKLQPGKKPVELNYWSDEESEVRSFLQCLPYISQLSFHLWRYEPSELIKFLVGLLSQAAEWEEQSGEKTLKLLSSVCTYSTFPLCDWDDDKKWFQSDFLLDLYSHVKDYETQTGRSVLPALQPVYQSAPAVWSIDLSERKVSLLLDVLKLQPEKKPVELKGWSDEDNQVRSFLQCLPYISQLSCDSDRFFQRVCESIPVRSREDAQHLASLLQALGSTLSLGDQLPRKTCRSVVRVLGLCASRVDLTLTPSKISLKGASLLFTRVSQLHKLRLNVGMSVRLARLARRTWRGGTPLTVPELSLVLKSSQPPERVLSRALSSVASLLRFWRVQCLDLTDFCIQGHSLITLLCHQGPLTLRLHSDTLQQLAVVVYEAQDKDLTQWFLEKVGGDLTSCRLDWEVLLSLLQHSTHNITVDLRKNRLPEKNISDLLPFLGRVIFKRLSSSFVKSIIRQIYNSRDSDCVSSLLRSSAQWINLNSRELDRVDCTSLCFTLQHSHQVKVNLLWTSIPPGEIESILPLLDRVSQLSVDRKLLLSFLHSCAASQILQGALSPTTTTTAAELLRALQYRLDFSCSSSVDLSAHDQGGALCLTTDHCRAINSVLKQSQHSTRLVQNPTQNQSRNQPHVQLILKD